MGSVKLLFFFALVLLIEIAASHWIGGYGFPPPGGFGGFGGYGGYGYGGYGGFGGFGHRGFGGGFYRFGPPPPPPPPPFFG